MLNFLKPLINKFRKKEIRRENAIADTKRMMQYCLDKIDHEREPHKTGLGWALMYIEFKSRLEQIERGALEIGWLDDVYDENGHTKAEWKT